MRNKINGGKMSKEIWKEKIVFSEGGEVAWGEIVGLLENRGTGTDGKNPIYIRFSDWNGDSQDYVEISNAPIKGGK